MYHHLGLLRKLSFLTTNSGNSAEENFPSDMAARWVFGLVIDLSEITTLIFYFFRLVFAVAQFGPLNFESELLQVKLLLESPGS
jgi:hypothetical protein